MVSSYQSTACGISLQVGAEYLIYAGSYKDSVLTVSVCSRTELLADALDDLRILGQPAATLQAGDVDPSYTRAKASRTLRRVGDAIIANEKYGSIQQESIRGGTALARRAPY